MTSQLSIDRLDWTAIAAQMDGEGYAVLPGLLGATAASDLAGRLQHGYAEHAAPLASTDLGRGDLCYFGADMPPPLGDLQTAFYRHLAVIANHWNEVLGVSTRYPAEWDRFLAQSKKAGRQAGQSCWTRLGEEDHVALHQRRDGEHVFPMQIVMLLSEPGKDFQGGEFVMTEQRPRMQSRPMVLPLKLGDAAIISTAERPSRGAKGYYRVNLKHAISRVHKGERIGVELTFHPAR